MSDAMLVELKQCFMEAYDDNQDGKIDIREVSILEHILPHSPHIPKLWNNFPCALTYTLCPARTTFLFSGSDTILGSIQG